MNIKQVLIVFQTSGIGGAEIQALVYGQHLSKAYGCKITVWNFLEGTPELIDRVKDCGFTYIEPGYPASKNYFKQKVKLVLLRIRIRKIQPDVILPYTIIPNVFMNLAGQIRSGKTVTTWNQRDEGIHNFEYDPQLISKALAGTDLIVSNSEGGLDYLEKLGADRAKCNLVMNGVPEKFFHDPARSPVTRRHQNHDHVCCMIANLHANKDHHTLIRSWKIVVDHFSDKNERCLLILAGGLKNTTGKIRELITSLGLEDHIRLEGFVKDIPHLIRQVDLMIHCSPSEGTSNSVLEAMAGGKAIVASRIRSIAGTVHESNLDFLYTDGDVNELSEKIIQLLEDPGLAEKIGRANHGKALLEFSTESYFRSMDSLIEGLLRSKGR